MKKSKPLDEIGWREWVALPELGIPRIKAKVDTGARSSALHAYAVKFFYRKGRRHVRFWVHPMQKNSRVTSTALAPLLGFRQVKDSGGKNTLRPVIETSVQFDDKIWQVEITLINRDSMGFRMLIGRQAIKKRFLVNPGKSFLGEKRARKRARKKI